MMSTTTCLWTSSKVPSRTTKQLVPGGPPSTSTASPAARHALDDGGGDSFELAGLERLEELVTGEEARPLLEVLRVV